MCGDDGIPRHPVHPWVPAFAGKTEVVDRGRRSVVGCGGPREDVVGDDEALRLRSG